MWKAVIKMQLRALSKYRLTRKRLMKDNDLDNIIEKRPTISATIGRKSSTKGMPSLSSRSQSPSSSSSSRSPLISARKVPMLERYPLRGTLLPSTKSVNRTSRQLPQTKKTPSTSASIEYVSSDSDNADIHEVDDSDIWNISADSDNIQNKYS